jgi:hypothetical protein
MKTTAEIKAALKTVREGAAATGLAITVTRSRRGIEPSVWVGDKLHSIDSALAALAPAEAAS